MNLETRPHQGPIRARYLYDAAGRLVTIIRNGTTSAAYGYDANANRIFGWSGGSPSSGTYNNQDQLLSYGSTTYGYDARGSLVATTNGSDVTAYDYDAFGNLRSVVLPDATEIEYVIDARQRRVGKKVDGQLVQGFLYWNQIKPVAELDGAGNVVSTFVYGRNPYVPEYMVKGGVTYRLVTDHVGSVRLVVKTQDGTVAQRIDYDEWGRVLQDTNPGFQPFGFGSGLHDADTGLVRFGYRDYDPKTGRWTARDPILFGGGQVNLYLYCHGDPVKWVDPWGLGEQEPWELEKEQIIHLAGLWVEHSRDGAFQVFDCNEQALELKDVLERLGPWENWSFDILSGYRGVQLFRGRGIFSESHNVVQVTAQTSDPKQRSFTLDPYRMGDRNREPRVVSVGTPEIFKEEYPKEP